MASSNLIGQLRKLSKRKFTLNYSFMNISGLMDYEKVYNFLKGKPTPKAAKLFFQYIIQSWLGIYRTDYGTLKSDYFLSSSDLLTSLLSSYQLLRKGNTVVLYYYQLDDFSLLSKLYSESRYETLPQESINLISGELNIDLGIDKKYEDVINSISDAIMENYSDNFMFIQSVSLSSFFDIGDGYVCSLVNKSSSGDSTTRLSSLNEICFLDSLVAGENSNKNRRRGRVVSMVKSKKVIATSQKTNSTPRVPEQNEIKIADGSRQTKDAKEIFVKDRNKDIIEALAINERIGFADGISK